jgi:hypothetical protein
MLKNAEKGKKPMANFMFDIDEALGNLQSTITTEKKTYAPDTRFWKLSKNAEGKGNATVRFLTDGNNLPFVQIYYYSLKKPNEKEGGKPFYFIANSPETIELPCPVKEHYDKLMLEGTKEAKDDAYTNYKRQIKFYTNIMVVNDPANPENNGKVKLFEFSVKFKDKLMGWLKPSDEEIMLQDEPENADEMSAEEILAFKKDQATKRIYDHTNGQNVRLKLAPNGTVFMGKPVSDLANSEVAPTLGAVAPKLTDEKSAMTWLADWTTPLKEFLSPEFYDSYEELSERFSKYQAYGSSVSRAKPAKASVKAPELDEDEIDETPAPRPSAKVSKPAPVEDDSWMDEIDN